MTRLPRGTQRFKAPDVHDVRLICSNRTQRYALLSFLGNTLPLLRHTQLPDEYASVFVMDPLRHDEWACETADLLALCDSIRRRNAPTEGRFFFRPSRAEVPDNATARTVGAAALLDNTSVTSLFIGVDTRRTSHDGIITTVDITLRWNSLQV
jgi:hypothetical protein